MKIIKFQDYIRENMNDTPENYIGQALQDILDKINEMFPNDEATEEPEDEVISFAQARERGAQQEEAQKKIKFADYGAVKRDDNLSRQSGTLTITIDEGENWYKIYFMIDLKSAVPAPDKDFSYKDIKDCKVKFVKYNKADKIEREISKTVAIADIDEDKLIELKIEVDGEEAEGLGIETEEAE